jgi:hypothetical protein
MPIRPEHRFLYPIDWPAISDFVRFKRAKGRCEKCGRRHRDEVRQLLDGRWFDVERSRWRDDMGQVAPDPDLLETMSARLRRVILAACHRNHDRGDCRPRNLAGWCGRCHLIHDRPEHLRQRRLTYLRRRAIGDLFEGLYPVF